jgi:hypothetical protein
MSLKITCERCNEEITHVCNADLVGDIVYLLKWRPHMGFPAKLKVGNIWVREVTDRINPTVKIDDIDDPLCPLLSETYLYALLGKEDARTFIALFNGIIRSAGLDPHVLTEQADQELELKVREIQTRQKVVAQRKTQTAKKTRAKSKGLK